jgi:HAD superfamily hydrolase (TIGR01549 family)
MDDNATIYVPTKWHGIRAILFDLGGTLLRNSITAEEERCIWEQVYTGFVIPETVKWGIHPVPSLERFYEVIVEQVGRVIARNGQNRSERELEYLPLFALAFETAGLPLLAEQELLRQVVGMELELRFAQLFTPGLPTVKTLKKLRERGYRLGLVSNLCCLAELVYANLERFGVLAHFDQAVFSCEIGWRKPSPRIFEAICTKMNIAPNECLFVGDRLIEDVYAPQKLGMGAILTHEFRQEIPDGTVQPDGIIRRLDQLLDILP